MILRELSDLQFQVGDDVVAAVEVIESLGGRHTHDSGHQEGPTWIYTFRQFQEAQVALRINRDKLSIYVRAQPHGRRDFEAALSQWAEVEQEYPNPEEKPANSLLSDNHAAFLTPRRGKLLRLRVEEGRLESLLRAYLPVKPPAPAVLLGKTPVDGSTNAESSSSDAVTEAGDPPELPASYASPQRVRVVSPEQLRQSLDRNDATGKAGERLAYLDELARLTRLGCPDPAKHVRLMAEENVAAGYDLRSEWNGELRCIEVKTTASGREQCFITENERSVLKALGRNAWLYRVDLSSGESGAVTLRLQDPMAHLEEDCFRPVVWQVELGPAQALFE